MRQNCGATRSAPQAGPVQRWRALRPSFGDGVKKRAVIECGDVQIFGGREEQEAEMPT